MCRPISKKKKNADNIKTARLCNGCPDSIFQNGSTENFLFIITTLHHPKLLNYKKHITLRIKSKPREAWNPDPISNSFAYRTVYLLRDSYSHFKRPLSFSVEPFRYMRPDMMLLFGRVQIAPKKGSAPWSIKKIKFEKYFALFPILFSQCCFVICSYSIKNVMVRYYTGCP